MPWLSDFFTTTSTNIFPSNLIEWVMSKISLTSLHPDCRHFKGHIPCKPHKQHGVHCASCLYYEATLQRILIIKLGAIGDVIRTTPLLHPLKKQYPHAKIFWVTHNPEVVPSQVDHVLKFDAPGRTILSQIKFDLLINLDKDLDACALAGAVHATTKRGFICQDGHPWPANEQAHEKFMTGLFDDLSKAVTKSYLQELFEIAGYTFQGEKYILDPHEGDYTWDLDRSRPTIGLNTGCGGRWTSRLWSEENWQNLAQRLMQSGYNVLLLGGEQEHEKNLRLAQHSGARYLGHFPLRQFINLVHQCDLVVTAVTMATHIAIGLNKKLVLFNNTFNAHEFELYGLGEIVQPEFQCDCYYAAQCPNNCMQYIYVDRVYDVCTRLL
jgi:ADP-heptose:LPS heptosyltransferase